MPTGKILTYRGQENGHHVEGLTFLSLTQAFFTHDDTAVSYMDAEREANVDYYVGERDIWRVRFCEVEGDTEYDGAPIDEYTAAAIDYINSTFGDGTIYVAPPPPPFAALTSPTIDYVNGALTVTTDATYNQPVASVFYVWYNSTDDQGNGRNPINGANGPTYNTYTPTPSDVGLYVSLTIITTNSQGNQATPSSNYIYID